MKGFEVECNGSSTSSPMLRLNNSSSLNLLNISLEGYVTVAGKLISWNCYNDSVVDAGAARGLDLEGTPYTFSDENMLTAVGCDAVALIQGLGGAGRNNYTGGCVSFCGNAREGVANGSCSGVGCCQVQVPEGLKSAQLKYSSIRGVTNPQSPERPCGKAFIARRGQYEFETGELEQLPYSVRDGARRHNKPQDEFLPVVLEWAIGTETCEQAITKREEEGYTFACKNNSDCYNSSRGFGYRCRCKPGYTGNPYLGCEDTDECADAESNNCAQNYCINEPGNYTCKCPPGKTGDGLRNGTGCSNKERLLEIYLGGGMGFLFLVLVFSLWSCWVTKKRKSSNLKEKYFQQNGGLFLLRKISPQRANRGRPQLTIFTIDQLERATNKFSDTRILGRGGHGIVYKGILPDQREVAIKKSRITSEDEVEQFINEVTILSQINHKNVVKLLGCCLETQVPLLVYEFVSNGTLHNHIHNNDKNPYSMLSWETRLRIASETANALAYLHCAPSTPIIHRDVKLANILLDDDYTTKVSDFGASRSVPFDQTHVTTLVQGTLGYLDPEYFQTSLLTEKSDVYSFGIVLVELLTREKPISFERSEDERNLASHFIVAFEKKQLRRVLEPQMVDEVGVEHLGVVARLAKRCLSLKGEERPCMKEVAMELEWARRYLCKSIPATSVKPRMEGLSREAPSSSHGDGADTLDTTEESILLSTAFPR